MRRTTTALALGLGALVGSWAFGSTPLAVVGLGFTGAALLVRVWARSVRGSIEIERRVASIERVEGDELVVEVSARRRVRLLGSSVVLRQELNGVERELALRGARGAIVFPELVRGRHVLDPMQIEITDPLGLERVGQTSGDTVTVLVRPRVPILPSVFFHSGSRDAGGPRSRFRRPTGFDIHAVRDYAPGEPLQAVHWPSTARRGRLMVKELDDSPQDELTIVLDQDEDGVAGPPGRSSFDDAVRAAGALARATAAAHRTAVIVGTDRAFEPLRLRSLGPDWEAALDALAAVRTVSGAHVEGALGHRSAVVARAAKIVVVTGRPERAAGPLVAMRHGGRAVSLVAVASETYAGRPRRDVDPSVLRAAAAGLPVAALAADTSIVDALSGRLGEAESA